MAASTSAARTAPSTRCARATGSCAGARRPPGAVKGAIALDSGQAVLRRLRRPGPRDPPHRRQEDLVDGTRRRSARPRRGQLLLDRRRRVRPRLHRQHERHGLLAVERRRQARVEPQHGRLRLRVAGRRAGPRRASDRLHRFLRRPLLRAQRAHRSAALGALAGHQDLRRCDDHRRRGLRLRPRPAHDVGARREHRQDAVEARAAARSTPRSATAGASTSPRTRRCSRSIRGGGRSTAPRRAARAARPGRSARLRASERPAGRGRARWRAGSAS